MKKTGDASLSKVLAGYCHANESSIKRSAAHPVLRPGFPQLGHSLEVCEVWWAGFGYTCYLSPAASGQVAAAASRALR